MHSLTVDFNFEASASLSEPLELTVTIFANRTTDGALANYQPTNLSVTKQITAPIDGKVHTFFGNGEPSQQFPLLKNDALVSVVSSPNQGSVWNGNSVVINGSYIVEEFF
jgi:hypothetical protein